MSQAGFISTSSGPPPPSVPTSFVTDNGTAVPALNILLVEGKTSTQNNANGVITKGGVVGTGTSNEVDIVLTNRLTGSVTTVGAANGDIITFTPTVVGVYSIEYRTAAYNTTSLIGAGYSQFGGVRFDGVNSNLCSAFDDILSEEGTMPAVDLQIVVSGANIILRATGYAGQTINWSSVGLYTFVGA
jgi:hypothetical protein